MNFGRNQQIGIGAMAVPFLTATVFVILDKMTAAEWLSLVQFTIPIVTGTVLALGGAVKVFSKPQQGPAE